ncbi:zinc finger protein 423-like [Centruroides vittatus]|uniref:zinc finger protein 423-like n=1 Tax=Centruroides vittatus TaxID=120091 RepID=UPI00350EBA2F
MAQLTCQIIGLNERPVSRRMSFESNDTISLIHHDSLEHQESPHMENHGCSGDEDGNSSENHSRSTPLFDAGCVEPRAKKRRKQSNPVRYQTTSIMPMLDSEEGEDVIGEKESMLDLETREDKTIRDQEDIYQCPHCSVTFEIENLLQFHIEEEHVQKLLDKQLQQQQSYNKSTSGHGREGNSNEIAKTFASSKLSDTVAQSYLGKQTTNSPLDTLTQENRDTKNQTMPFPTMPPLIPFSQSNENKSGNLSVPLSMFPGPIPPFLFPVIPQGQNSSLSNGGSHQNQGVRIFNLEAYCELCNKEFCNKYFLKTHKANKHGIYSVESIVSTPFSGTYTPTVSGNTFSVPQTMQTSPSESSSTTKQQGLINVESYCEICQKEFCNKYFLKKHKQKSHGLIDNTQSASPSHTPATSESKINSPISIANSPPSTSMNEQTIGSIQEEPQDLSKIEFPSLYNSQSQQNIPVTNGIVSTASSMINHPISISTSAQEGLCISHTFTGSPVFTPDKLREMGVINADAFCEICCKEFCNKYFLRTHKINKHGLSATETSTSPLHSQSHMSTSCLMQSSQFYSSFDKNDENSCPKSVDETQKDMQFSQRSQYDSDVTTDLSCEICNRPFSSLYLLKMHKFYTHNIPYIKEEERSKPTSPAQNNANIEGKESGEVTAKSQMYESIGCNLTDTASQDLQKLQTMITELNAVTGSESTKLLCSLCHLEFENKYFLRAHMMNEHGVLPNEDGQAGNNMEIASSIQRSLEGVLDLQKTTTSAPVIDSEAYCEICQKEFCSKYFLKTHKQNIHGILPEASPTPKKQSGPETAVELSNPVKLCASNNLPPATPEKPRNVTGRNYCNICNKELCNKYFMKTHMLKMHGINLDSQPNEAARSSTIGGVTCDICQKELCSKYFLKVHKQNTHGIYEEPSPVKDSPSFVAFNNDKEFSSSGDLNDPTNRYFSNYSEVCPLCDRRFKSVKWLKAHMLNDHTGMMKDNQFPTQVENTNIDSNNELCMICGQNFPDKIALQVHLIKDHRTTNEDIGITNNSGMNTTSDSSTTAVQDQARTNGSTSPGSSSSSVQVIQSRLPIKLSGIGGNRIYHCSFCIYSTRWLSNLYAHEKRHTGVNTEGEKRFVCRICHRAYRYNHSLQRHFLNHRAAGFSFKDISHSSLSSSHHQKRAQSLGQQWDSSRSATAMGKSQDDMQHSTKVKRYRCSKCNKKFRTREMCLAHIHNIHSGRRSIINQQKHVKIFRCRLCGFATKVWSILKLHIKQHQGATDVAKDVQQESDASASSPSTPNNMQVVPKLFPSPGRLGCPSNFPSSTNSSQLPMTFAMPQNPPAAGSFIMQPFLLAQPESDGVAKNGTFVPSLVYLPVCQKVLHPVTLPFTLTPA